MAVVPEVVGGVVTAAHAPIKDMGVVIDAADQKSKPLPKAVVVWPDPFRQTEIAQIVDTSHLEVREEGTIEFVHRWEQLLGEMCRAGLVIEDLFEPFHAEREADVMGKKAMQ